MSSKAERLNAPMARPEMERRWAAVRAAMAARGIDVLLMQANNDFMGGYVKWFTDLPATQGYAVIVTFPREEDMTVIGQGPFGGDSLLPAGGDDVRPGVRRVLTTPAYASAGYTHAYEADLAADALAPWAKGVVGLVGLSTLSYHLIDSLKRGPLSAATFVDASDMVDAIKAIKSPEEIRAIRATAGMQDQAMAAAFAAFRPGAFDRDVTGAATAFSLGVGSEQGLYMCASSPSGVGVHFADRHFQARRIAANDQLAILVENSGPGGYFTELGRTCVLGKADGRMHDEFGFVLEARRFMLGLLRPGVAPAEVWTAYNDFMTANGKPGERRLHCHGMGYDMVERPLVRFDDPMPLAAGMVVSCHPTYETPHGLHWICDNYLIGETGCERLHAYPEVIVEID